MYLGDKGILSCCKVGTGGDTCLNVVYTDMSLLPCGLIGMSVVVTVHIVCKVLCLGGIFGF